MYNAIVETQIVFQNLLSRYSGLLAHVIIHPSQGFSHPLVRESAVFALCKYMAVSNDFCEKFLPLIFTVLERDPGETLKTTIMVAIGDFAFRFPNTVEPWTDKIYAR